MPLVLRPTDNCSTPAPHGKQTSSSVAPLRASTAARLASQKNICTSFGLRSCARNLGCGHVFSHLAQRKDGAALYAARCPAFLLFALLTRVVTTRVSDDGHSHFRHVTSFFPRDAPTAGQPRSASHCRSAMPTGKAPVHTLQPCGQHPCHAEAAGSAARPLPCLAARRPQRAQLCAARTQARHQAAPCAHGRAAQAEIHCTAYQNTRNLRASPPRRLAPVTTSDATNTITHSYPGYRRARGAQARH